MAATPQRPRQVTLAGWMIVVGSAVVVFSAFERVSGLRSIESQEAVADFGDHVVVEAFDGLTATERFAVDTAISLGYQPDCAT